MNKRLVCLLFAVLILTTGLVVSAEPDAKELNITLDNRLVELEGFRPVIVDSRSYADEEFIDSRLKGRITWNEDQSIATIVKTFSDRTTKEIEVQSLDYNGMKLLPLRAVAEAIGYEIGWDYESYTVSLKPVHFLVGRNLPLLEWKNNQGDTIILNKYTNTPYILEFMGTWCGFCVRMAPILNEFSEAYPEVPIVTVALRDTEETVAKFKETHNYKHDIFILSQEEYDLAKNTYGLTTVPAFVFVDENGVVTDFTGSISLEEIKERIR